MPMPAFPSTSGTDPSLEPHNSQADDQLQSPVLFLQIFSAFAANFSDNFAASTIGHELELTGKKLRQGGYTPAVISQTLSFLELYFLAQKQGKFGYKYPLLLTRDGLEQATRTVVSSYHAELFKAAGVEHIADLGCACGADSLAFVEYGISVTAVEIDQFTAQIAQFNLEEARRYYASEHLHTDTNGEVNAQVICDDVYNAEFSGEITGFFLDPARRTGAQKGSSRLAKPDTWSPSLEWAWQRQNYSATEECSTPPPNAKKAVIVKTAPGLPYEYIPADARAQFISVNGQIVECLLLNEKLSPQGPGRSAVIFRGEKRFIFDGKSQNPQNPPVMLPACADAEASQLLEWSAVTDSDSKAKTNLNERIFEPDKEFSAAESDLLLWEPDSAIIRAGILSELDFLPRASRLVSNEIAYVLIPGSKTDLSEEPGQEKLTSKNPSLEEAALENAVARNLADADARTTTRDFKPSNLGDIGSVFKIYGVWPLAKKGRGKQIAGLLGALGAKSYEIKTRGLDLNPDSLRKEVKYKATAASGKHHQQGNENTASAKVTGSCSEVDSYMNAAGMAAPADAAQGVGPHRLKTGTASLPQLDQPTLILTRLAGKPTLFLGARWELSQRF